MVLHLYRDVYVLYETYSYDLPKSISTFATWLQSRPVLFTPQN